MDKKKLEMLTGAFVDIVNTMNISDQTVSKILGVGDDFMEKLRKDQTSLPFDHNTSKSLTQFITAMDYLFRLVGQKESDAVKWLNQQNREFSNQTPIDYMASNGGLDRVTRYLKESNSPY